MTTTDDRETATVIRFAAGDTVPDWLISQVPRDAGATPGAITFERNTAAVKVDGVYWLLCLDSPHMQAVVNIKDSVSMVYGAATADVAFCSANLVLEFEPRPAAPGQTITHYKTLSDFRHN